MDQLYKQHNKWIKIAKTFGAGDVAEDLVQDAYIVAMNWKSKVNESLFYFMLRNVTMDHFRKEKRVYIYIEPQQFLNEQLYSFIDTFHPYDRKLYLTYINEKLSMRDIAKETGISLTSIYNTIKNCNETLKKFIEQSHEIQP